MPHPTLLVLELVVKKSRHSRAVSGTKVRSVAGESSNFGVKVVLLQGYPLSLYLFFKLMDVLTEKVIIKMDKHQ